MGNASPPLASGGTLADMLRERAAVDPDRRAYAFIDDDDVISSVLTFAELDRRSRAIAAFIQSRARQKDRVLLFHPPGLDYLAAFYGCFYAGVVAVPVFPHDQSRARRSAARLQAIMADAEASLALTSRLV